MGVARAKQSAARAAAQLVENGMIVGLGSGTTAEIAVEEIGLRVQQGLKIVGVPTSEKTALLARKHSIALADLDSDTRLDITIDGADEVDPDLNLIKGHGGALLREKLVGEATTHYVIVVDKTKVVSRLGSGCPIPIEIVPFGWRSTASRLHGLGLRCEIRGGSVPYLTDGHNYILDCHVDCPQADWPTLANRIKLQTGVVEHGLFIDMAEIVLVGSDNDEVERLTRLR